MDNKAYSFKKVYTLVAQTPLIHFQWEQEGATLRATEVKPKLDRFLIEKAKAQGIDWGKWRINEKSDALNYKMRLQRTDTDKTPTIRVRGEQVKATIDNFKFFFGNMASKEKDRSDFKQIVTFDIELTIECFISQLREFIHSNIKEFFILNNFGTRQSKGFGGFLVDGTALDEIAEIIKNAGMPYFCFFGSQRASSYDLMNHAMAVYAVMKGGLNHSKYDAEQNCYGKKDGYIKGFIQREFIPKGIGSDKAFLKSKIIPKLPGSTDRPNNTSNDYDEYMFVRALLGLADHYEFRDDIRCRSFINKKGKTDYEKRNAYFVNYDNAYIDNSGRLVVPESEIKADSGIKRLKSPVTIKVFEQEKLVVFLFNDSYKAITDKIFAFMDDDKYKEFNRLISSKNYEAATMHLAGCHFLKTPSSFDTVSFVQDFLKYFEKEKHWLGNCMPPYSFAKNISLKKEIK